MIPGIIESARWVAPFIDTFNRSNNNDIATLEYQWQELTGNWQIDSNNAYTATTAASYPLAIIDILKENVSVRSTGTNTSGYGVAFWVVDSNNWWAAVTDSTSSSTTTQAYTCPDGGSLSGTTCLKTCTTTTTSTVYYCPDGGNLSGTTCQRTCSTSSSYYTGGTCPANQSVSPNSQCICNDPGGCACSGNPVDVGSCTCYTGYYSPEFYPGYCSSIGYLSFNGNCYTGSYSGSVSPYSYTGSGCTLVTNTSYYDCSYPASATQGNPVTTTYNCDYAATLSTVTVTTYTHTMRLLRNVAGTVTQIATSTFSSSTSDSYPATMRVTTNQNEITVTGTTGGSSVSFGHTASSPTRGTKHGIIIAPATRSQSTRIDQFEYIN